MSDKRPRGKRRGRRARSGSLLLLGHLERQYICFFFLQRCDRINQGVQYIPFEWSAVVMSKLVHQDDGRIDYVFHQGGMLGSRNGKAAPFQFVQCFFEFAIGHGVVLGGAGLVGHAPIMCQSWGGRSGSARVIACGREPDRAGPLPAHPTSGRSCQYRRDACGSVPEVQSARGEAAPDVLFGRVRARVEDPDEPGIRPRPSGGARPLHLFGVRDRHGRGAPVRPARPPPTARAARQAGPPIR